MNDTATLTAQPRPLVALGKTYLVHPLRIEDLGRLQAWVDSRWPDPFEAVAAQIGSGRFNRKQEEHLLKCATELAARPRPRIGHPDTQPILFSLEGLTHLFWLAVHKGDPSFTVQEAERVASTVGLEGLSSVFALTNLDMVADPKAPAPMTGAPPQT